MKRIIIDFETNSNNPLKADMIEFTALFVEEEVIINEINTLIKFEEKWEKLKQHQIAALNFNKIFNQEELDLHNSKARDNKEVIFEFLDKVKKFSNEKLGITGWNNASFDNVILRRNLEKYGFEFNEYFDYHSRDIMNMFLPIYNQLLKDKFSLHLKDAHMYLIKTLEDKDFHIAKNDCIATLDIDLWIHEKMKELK